jgi:hypothetical protein
MKDLQIPAHEQGTTRLFTLSIGLDAARAVKTDTAKQAALLGVEHVNAAGVEVFGVADLGDLGLAGYLRDGIDAQENDLARDRAKLAALDGWVMLLHSSALNGESTLLRLKPELTLVGTYARHSEDKTPVKIVSEAAQPYTGTPDITPAKAPNTNKAGSLAVLGLVLMAVILLWWALA